MADPRESSLAAAEKVLGARDGDVVDPDGRVVGGVWVSPCARLRLAREALRLAEVDAVEARARGEDDPVDESDPCSVGARGDLVRRLRLDYQMAERADAVVREVAANPGKHG